MTANQIAYNKAKEEQRHNRYTEQTDRAHYERMDSETNRHNVASEGFERGKLNESIRHNQAGESESRRHNVADENIINSWYSGQLAETHRHNVINEGISTHQAQSQRLSATASYLSAQQQSRLADASLMQAGVAAENARINQFNAMTRRDELELGYEELARTDSRLNIDAQNAQTNAINAAANQRNAATRFLEYGSSTGGNVNEDVANEIAQQRADTEQQRSEYQNLKDATSGLDSVTRTLRNGAAFALMLYR